MDTIRSYTYQSLIDPLSSLKLQSEFNCGVVQLGALESITYQKEEREGAIRDMQSFVIMNGIGGTLFCEEDYRVIKPVDITELSASPGIGRRHQRGKRCKIHRTG